MLLAKGKCFARHGNVDGLALELGSQSSFFQTCLVLGQTGFDCSAQIVDHLTKSRTLFRSQAAHVFHQRSYFTLFTQVFDANGVKLARILTGLHSLLGKLANGL